VHHRTLCCQPVTSLCVISVWCFYSLKGWSAFVFSALMLLVGWQEGHPAVKTEWWGTCMVICLERRANDLHMVQLMPLPPIISCSSKIQNVIPFWCRITQVVVEKRPLNGCSNSSKGWSVPCLGSRVVGQGRMRSQWVILFVVGVSAVSSLQCFDTVSWSSGKAFSLWETCSQRFSVGDLAGRRWGSCRQGSQLSKKCN